MKHLFNFFVSVSCVVLCGNMAFCQGAGYGAQSNRNQYFAAPKENTTDFITIRGRAEIAVAPESLRLVFGVTSQSSTTQDCVAKNNQTISTIKQGLGELEISAEEIVEDFIVMTPTYEWKLEQKPGQKPGQKPEQNIDVKTEQKQRVSSSIAKESKTGFRMQTNLHVLCENEAQAYQVMAVAFKNGVHEIISFDYYHSNIEQFKKAAIKEAIADAKSKSELLLSVLGNGEQPQVLNINHTEQVKFPQSQYKTVNQNRSNPLANVPRSLSSFTKLLAYRPKLTFYAGSRAISGSNSSKPAMKPQILVLSEVVLTYSSPARDQRIELIKQDIESRRESEN